MADNRKTELIDQQNRQTSIMEDKDRTTAIMKASSENGSSKVTELMNNTDRTTSIISNGSAIDFTRRTSIDNYKIKKIIAENTGEASLLLTETNEENQVVKLYHLNSQPDARIENALSKIDSPYIMPHKKGGVYDNRTYEILPYYEKGDLEKNLPMNEQFIESVVVKSVNDGLKVLHDNGIIHRDIKPSNLFLSNDGNKVILGDFGISSLLDSNVSVRATSMSRTFGYSAPEASSGFVSKETDYYSLGITILHLAIGQDPFLGMTDMQILYQTINKPLDIPSNVSPRLQQLIKGLTIKDRNNRWGYDEVTRWLNNEDVEIKERKTFKGLKPYNFNYNKYYGLEEISMAFANDWENAKKHLYRGYVEKNIAQYGEEYVNQITDVKNISDQDVAVFSMIYILNPHAPLCFKGVVYTDLQSLGMKMHENGTQTNDDIMQLITSECLSQYIHKNNFENNFTNQIDELSKKIKAGKKDYYYALMYLLYPEIGYEYNKKKYVNLEDFIEDLEKTSSTQINKTCQDLIGNPMFLMWINSLGYSKQVDSWLKIYEKAVW